MRWHTIKLNIFLWTIRLKVAIQVKINKFKKFLYKL